MGKTSIRIRGQPVGQGITKVKNEPAVGVDHEHGGCDANDVENKANLHHIGDPDAANTLGKGIGSRRCRQHEGIGAAQGGRHS